MEESQIVLNILKQLNWVDVFVIIVLLRICYIALKNGLPVEFFKFLGTISAIYISLHYYTRFSDWIGQHTFIPKEKMPLEFLDFLSFIILVICSYSAFVFLREAFCRLIRMDVADRLNRWLGLALGILRGFLLLGLITFILVISSISYLKNSVGSSYSGRHLFNLGPAIYSRLWNNLMSKFMIAEEFNKTILDVKKDFIPHPQKPSSSERRWRGALKTSSSIK